jgi:hypothetical protein
MGQTSEPVRTVTVNKEVYDLLVESARALPYDEFVKEGTDDEPAIMSCVDAADYKDNCGAFDRAMLAAYKACTKIADGE